MNNIICLKNFRVFRNVSLKTLVVVALTMTSFAKAEKEVLFEGYSKVTINKQHIGYSISRYEFDPISKKFFATVFTKTGALGGNFIESIKAISDSAMSPVSYEYTTLVTEGNKTSSKKIDAVFRAKKSKKTKKGAVGEIKTLLATVTQDGKMSKIETDLPEGSFMSYFLVYLMLKSKSGLQTGSKYEYKAIAEEKAKITSGEAKVTTMEDFKGLKAYKIDNEFDNQKFTSFVTDRGEVLGVINPASGVEAELVAKPNEAVGEFPFPTATLKTLFGEVPLGTNNIVSKTLKQESLKSVTEPPGSKQFGTPAGSGIVSKPGTTSTVEVEKIEKPMPTATDSKDTPKKK
jgi:hypothetical protein